MKGEFTLTLNSPITEEQWDAITDVDFEHTNEITFHTKHGKEVVFVKKSAQPEQRWIPLKEREPKEEGEYLVSFDDGFIATTGYYDNDFELWEDAGEPLAWMPLPEPYRAKRRTDE